MKWEVGTISIYDFGTGFVILFTGVFLFLASVLSWPEPAGDIIIYIYTSCSHFLRVLNGH